MAAIRQTLRRQDVIHSAFRYMKSTIGSHRVYNTKKRWDTLVDVPYKNPIFTAQMVGDQVEFQTNLSYTPALNMLMMTESDSIDFVPQCSLDHAQGTLEHNISIYADLEIDEEKSQNAGEEVLVLDTQTSFLPGRWACMLHDFYFGETGIVDEVFKTMRMSSEVPLTFDDVIEAYTSLPFGQIDIIQGPQISKYIEECMEHQTAFENHATHMQKMKHEKGQLYGGLWGTWQNEVAPSTFYFLNDAIGLKSVAFDGNEENQSWDASPEYEVDMAVEGLRIPKGYFCQLDLDFASLFAAQDQSLDSFVTGDSKYSTNDAVPIEELVVFAEAVRRSGGNYSIVIHESTIGQKKTDDYYELFA